MPSLPNPIKIATKGAEIGFQVGTFVAGQAFQRVQSLVGGDSKNGGDTYSPVQPPKPQDKPEARSPQPPKLEAVKTPGETSTGSKPTTSTTTATGPGGTNRMAPKAPAARKPAAKKPAARKPAQKEITAPPATGGTKGETSTTIKASSRTGARSAGGRISNPKAAAKARKRAAGASAKTGAGAGSGPSVGSATAAARSGDLSKAKGKGGRPATVKAENSPAELAKAKSGKQAAPLGGDAA